MQTKRHFSVCNTNLSSKRDHSLLYMQERAKRNRATVRFQVGIGVHGKILQLILIINIDYAEL